MEKQIFTGGVKPGGLTADYEIKILVCYLLHHIGKGMSFEEISDVLQTEGVANYFEYSQAVNKLLGTGHIKSVSEGDEQERFVVTALGVKTSLSLEKSLPLSVREGTLRTAQEYLLRKKIERENQVEITRQADGYKVSMRITDIGSDLMSLSLFVPTEEDGERVKKRFHSDPAAVYRGIVAMLTGDEATVRAMLAKTISDTQDVQPNRVGEEFLL